MTPLNIKLWRGLWHMKGQVLAIALIVACGSGVLIMSLSVHQALSETAEAYYERNRFADVFANARRAPLATADRIATIDGVKSVQTRVVGNVILQVAGVEEPVQGRLVSLPDHSAPILNTSVLRSGRLPEPGHADEVMLSEQFAEANGLSPGTRFHAVMNGRKRLLKVVGTALSPEFIYIIAPGALMPDDERYGVMWMRRSAVASVFDMDGAFNDVSLSISREANVSKVIDALDVLLAPYGGTGAIARKDQVSNWFVMNEIQQIKTMATIFPTVFMAVAAFLTNMLLMRLIAIERGEIGLLKANGYSNWAVSWHYLKLAAVVAGLGVILGVVLGYYLGRLNTMMYAESYRFPILIFRVEIWVVITAALVSLAAAGLGALNAVSRVVRLAPAEAMRPPQPLSYKRSKLANWGPYKSIDQATRIVLRQISRTPLRSATTTFGIGAGIGVMIMALQWIDAIEELLHVQYFEAQRNNLTIALNDPRAMSTLYEIENLPGVMHAEPSRGVDADLRNGTRTHRGSVVGIVPDALMQPLYDNRTGERPISGGGITIGLALARKLDVTVGDSVTISVLTGRRPVVALPVVDIIETYLGMPAYMRLSDLNKLLGDAPSFDLAYLQVDRARLGEFHRALREVPLVAGIADRHNAISMFEQTIQETVYIFIAFYSGFALLLSFGVSYNSGRIALSENGRDLATLRVLGFTRSETGYVSFAETAFLALAAIPIGFGLGWGLSSLVGRAFETELFRLPPVITTAVLGWSAVVAIAATIGALALIVSRVARLDLISVLKTRE